MNELYSYHKNSNVLKFNTELVKAFEIKLFLFAYTEYFTQNMACLPNKINTRFLYFSVCFLSISVSFKAGEFLNDGWIFITWVFISY